MKTLLILRHAKSSWKDASLAEHDRPLNGRGKSAAPRMGRLIQDEGIVPERILSSTAKRARTTAALVAQACGFPNVIELNPELYHADSGSCLSVLRDSYYDDPCLMLVGHNPGLEELLEVLTGRFERLPTAALAQLSVPIEHWYEIATFTPAVLVNLWRPRELD
jgi:phosphohistidine phosphatase